MIEIEIEGRNVGEFLRLTWKEKREFLVCINALQSNETLRAIKRCRTCGRMFAVIYEETKSVRSNARSLSIK